ncbi:MAG: hypothetical protein HRT88_04220 [Lentisphaeraceae bacterium]|nr:hypothetical protein [Lentisphaeraceae bacterium]
MKTYFHHQRYKGDSNKEFIFVHLMSRLTSVVSMSTDEKVYRINFLDSLNILGPNKLTILFDLH